MALARIWREQLRFTTFFFLVFLSTAGSDAALVERGRSSSSRTPCRGGCWYCFYVVRSLGGAALTPTGGKPRLVLPRLDGQPSVQPALDNFYEGVDPQALCRELSEESDTTEKALRVNLDQLSVVRQKLAISCVSSA